MRLAVITVPHLSVLFKYLLITLPIIKFLSFQPHETQSLHVTIALRSFTAKIELECQDDLSPEELAAYCTVDSYYR